MEGKFGSTTCESEGDGKVEKGSGKKTNKKRHEERKVESIGEKKRCNDGMTEDEEQRRKEKEGKKQEEKGREVLSVG